MSSTEEMRRVMTHAAEGLREALAVERGRSSINAPHSLTLMKISYAEAVLDLLATYLDVTDEPPRRTGPTPPRDEAGRFLPREDVTDA